MTKIEKEVALLGTSSRKAFTRGLAEALGNLGRDAEFCRNGKWVIWRGGGSACLALYDKPSDRFPNTPVVLRLHIDRLLLTIPRSAARRIGVPHEEFPMGQRSMELSLCPDELDGCIPWVASLIEARASGASSFLVEPPVPVDLPNHPERPVEWISVSYCWTRRSRELYRVHERTMAALAAWDRFLQARGRDHPSRRPAIPEEATAMAMLLRERNDLEAATALSSLLAELRV